LGSARNAMTVSLGPDAGNAASRDAGPDAYDDGSTLVNAMKAGNEAAWRATLNNTEA